MLREQIFKANGIHGVVTGADPELDLGGSRRLGAVFVELLDLSGGTPVMDHDTRQLGEELSMAFADGARRAGASIADLGLTSTDLLWFDSGQLDLSGVQFTVSHNPARYNGMKFCLAGVSPVCPGLTAELRERAATMTTGEKIVGDYEERDLTVEFMAHLGRLVPMTRQRWLKVVVDAGSGMAGSTVPKVLANREVDLIGLYMEPDGTFPNHPASPLEPENLVDARSAVREHSADLGLVFDGDADRYFLIDEWGEVVDPSIVTAMVTVAELFRETGGTIMINAITSQAVADAVAGLGNVEVSRVGHTFVKALMVEKNAVFGDEHSAHYYFRDFWGVDTGVLAALHILEQLRSSAELLLTPAARFDGYERSGEINSTIIDHRAAMEHVAKAFEERGGVEYWDGLTVHDERADWWISLRPSNTEPLLRLNVGARDAETMVRLRDEVLTIVRAHEGEADK